MEDLADAIRQIHESGAGTDVERRSTSRVRRNGMLCIQVPGPNEEPLVLTVQFRDCSQQGIGFVADLPLEKGSEFHIVVQHQQRGDVLLSYEVIRCNNIGPELYHIGARIIR